jgi:hypothetical protein
LPIGNEFFDAKATEMRAAQTAVIRDLDAHQTANCSYIEEGVQLLELAHRAHVLFESQPAAEKRKLLDFVLSNCTWKGGELTAKYRQPFDVLAVAVASEQQRMGGGSAETARNDIWLPGMDSNHDCASAWTINKLLILRSSPSQESQKKWPTFTPLLHGSWPRSNGNANGSNHVLLPSNALPSFPIRMHPPPKDTRPA